MRSAPLLTPLDSDSVPLQSFADGIELPLTAVASLFLIIGLVNIYLYRSNEATADRLKRTAATGIDSLTDGPVAVSGTARPALNTLERPTKDGECLAFERRTRVTRKKVDNDPDGDQNREVAFQTTHSSSSESTAFYVEDDNGTVLVTDDETPTLHVEQTDSVEEIPDDLEEKEREYESRDSYSLVTKKNHRYSELLPGDEVFVFGEAHRGAIQDGGEVREELQTEARIAEHGETGDFIVTTFDRAWLIDEYTDRVQLVIGLVVTGLSLAFLGYIWLL